MTEEPVKKVFVLQHQYNDGSEDENWKLIGVYSDEEKASEAINRLRNQPGFKSYPDGFIIGPYILDKDYWAEGFETE